MGEGLIAHWAVNPCNRSSNVDRNLDQRDPDLDGHRHTDNQRDRNRDIHRLGQAFGVRGPCYPIIPMV